MDRFSIIIIVVGYHIKSFFKEYFQFKLLKRNYYQHVKKKIPSGFVVFSLPALFVVYLVDGEKNKSRKCLDRESNVVLTPTQTSQCSNK